MCNASCNVDFSLIVISGLLIICSSVVDSAYTVASLTLLKISSSVTIPTGNFLESTTTMSSVS